MIAAVMVAAATPVGLAGVGLAAGAVVSLSASLLLVTSVERVAERLGLSEAILGLVAALGANAPEITSAVTALLRGEHEVGVGVILGSNVFNLAALLGLGAVVGRRIRLHRRVVLLAGSVALWLSLVSVGTVSSSITAVAGVVLVLVVFLPFVILAAAPSTVLRHVPLPKRSAVWLRRAILEEEVELHQGLRPQPGGRRDALRGIAALVAVVGGSVVMERSASALGAQLKLSNIVVGGVILAVVTSLPNAVAAVYLASRGRGAAVLSEALNSNNLNVLLGLLIPAALLGLSHSDTAALVSAIWFAALTLWVLALAYARRGLGRIDGAVVIIGYLGFVAAVVLL